MIGILFSFATEIVETRIDNNNVLFRTQQFGSQFATIEGLRLQKPGVIKEFPDLEGKKDWKEQAIKRFKDKIKKMRSEKEIADYLIEDLTKYGYKPLWLQRKGHRPQKL